MSFNLHNGVYNFTTSTKDGSLKRDELINLLKCEKEYLNMKYGIDTRKMIVPKNCTNKLNGCILDATNLATEALFDNKVNLLKYDIICDAIMINRFTPGITLAYPTNDNPVITIESDYAILLSCIDKDKLDNDVLESIIDNYLSMCDIKRDNIKLHIGPCCSNISNNLNTIINNRLENIGIKNIKIDNRDTITDDDLFSEIGNKKGCHLTGIYYKPDIKTLKLLKHHSKLR